MARRRARLSRGARRGERPEQEEARLLPVALHRPLGEPCIAAISTNEKPQKNFRSTTSASRGSTAPSSSSAARALELRRRRGRRRRRRFEGGDLEGAAALLGPPAAGVIDDERAHHPRRVAHEPRPVRERRAVAPGHVQIRLVQQGGRAERQLAARVGPAAAGRAGAARGRAPRTGRPRPAGRLVARRDEIGNRAVHGSAAESSSGVAERRRS